ncbi:Male sterility protein [Aspergillus sclerotialis]|uniref:Male sterility protein n=1 Tax=Aspergillus sclerotialis TaxID=2070753 RepID=A0A3A3A7F7_9EURO|nr:Male sterility protein [Aspergillus sclerotialis]
MDPGSRVLVTGGNGFIGAHCISTLLQSNHLVRATVRSSAKATATVEALKAAGVPNLQNLETVVVEDPTKLDEFSKVLPGCQGILHLASAFSYEANPGEFEEKLLKPALNGTKVVVQAAAKYPEIKRVVIMSSFASIYDANLGLQPGRVYTEKDWCPLTYEDGRDAGHVAIAYRASKVIAEKAAWDFIRDNPVNYTLVTLCPGMVFGRMIHPISSLSQLNTSNQIVWGVISAGEGREMPPTKGPVWTDVEDLSLISLRSLTYPLSSHERFLTTEGSYDTQEIADIVRAQLPDKQGRIPVGEPGKRIADTHFSCDSAKVQKVLGVKFRKLEDSIVPLAKQLYALEESPRL